MRLVLTGKPYAAAGGAQGKGDQGPMAQSSLCSRTNCSNQGVASLEDQNYCFEHFCGRCYELLERMNDAASRLGSLNFAESLTKLDECSQRALEISLSETELSNLDRARLLDILLWSGDLTTLLRRKRTAKGIAEAERAAVLGTVVGGRD